LAALRLLQKAPQPRPAESRDGWRDQRIRILTYNVHGCVGMDGELSPERIARVIAQSGANIVCLQELDVFRRRSGNRDQAHAIAMHLEMSFQFHPAWHLEEEQFGNAILTRFPMRVIESAGIHHHNSDRSRRSALWAEIDVDERTSLQIINTHLSIYPQEQRIQARELMDQWVRPAALLGPVVLCGDFNARPNSATHKEFSKSLFDVESFDKTPTRSTYFSPFPVSRVDHIFVSHEMIGEHIQVVHSRIARVASDHLPLVADLKLTTDAKRAVWNEDA
jgi:endonuclease/exonuclease/phosphatase family metal-dependent hydrolase